MAFGDQVRAVRLQRGLSQVDLADASGLHRTYVGGVERGERNLTLTNMGRLARALEVSLADLVQGLEDGRRVEP